jgi:hypothetical protein
MLNMSGSDLIGSYSEPTKCPRCGDRIRLEDVRVFVKPNGPYPKCRTCGTSIRVSIVYQRLIMLIAFALGWLIPYFIGLRAYAVVAWFPFYLLACLLVPNVAKVTVPPKLEDAESATHRSVLRRNVELFLLLWFGWAFFIFLNGALSAAVEGKSAFFGYLSAPLGWFDPAFVVGSETTSIGVLTIVLANTFVSAVCLFPLTMIFQAAFRRSHITQLGINRSEKDQDEDDDEARVNLTRLDDDCRCKPRLHQRPSTR